MTEPSQSPDDIFSVQLSRIQLTALVSILSNGSLDGVDLGETDDQDFVDALAQQLQAAVADGDAASDAADPADADACDVNDASAKGDVSDVAQSLGIDLQPSPDDVVDHE